MPMRFNTLKFSILNITSFEAVKLLASKTAIKHDEISELKTERKSRSLKITIINGIKMMCNKTLYFVTIRKGNISLNKHMAKIEPIMIPSR